MDRATKYSSIIRDLLRNLSQLYCDSSLQTELVFDEEHGHYHLGEVGWENDRRIDSVLVHIDLKGEQIWIQRNWTETRVAEELVEMGVPRDKIVLGFKHPDLRPDTQYAVV